MHLEAIEVEGFKSYGVKTVITPIDKSFTAITGLNGTGKSNILDAICFVLGVDTPRLLRAHTLKDLIFKQTKTATNSAKVSLIFNNKEKEKRLLGYEDIDLIKLTRIVTEEGKTKYLLNNHNVSTKSVRRLLQCVGLSSSKSTTDKTPYFIVMQGRVSKILSMKSTQFLTLLEECSGTSVYRTEKHKAYSILEKKEKKLLNTKETLSRTIFPFLNKLKKERDEYYIQKESIQRKRNIRKETEKIKEMIEYKEKEETVKEKEEIKKRNKKLEEEIENKIKEIVNVEVSDVDIENIQEKIDKKKREISKLLVDVEEEEKEILNKKVKNIEKEIGDVLNKYEVVVSRLKVGEETENTVKERTKVGPEEKMKVGINELKIGEERVKGLNARENDAEKVTVREEIEQRLLELEVKEKAVLQMSRGQSVLEKERKKEVLSAALEELNRKASKLDQKIKELGLFGVTEAEARDSIEQYKKVSKESVENIRKDIQKIKIQLGYPVIEGVYGKVKELIEVKDKVNEIAVGVVLGGRKEYIIVENEEIGKAIIEEVSREGRRVDVIPLNRISSRRIDPKKEDRAREYGSIPLVEAVEYPKDIKKALEYLLGGYILSKDRKTAVELRDREDLTSVTVEGELFDRRGTVTGGSLEVGKYKIEKSTHREKLSELERKEKEIKKFMSKCPGERLKISQEYVEVLEERRIVITEISQRAAELEVLQGVSINTEEIKSISENIQSLTEIKNILNLKYKSKESIKNKLKEVQERLHKIKEREKQLKKEIAEEEAKKLQAIKDNEINRARRSVQIKERRRIESEIDQMKKEKVKNEIRYRKIENVRIEKKKDIKQSKEHLEEDLRLLENELSQIKIGPEKEMNAENIEILQRNEEVEMALKEKLEKLNKDKKTIEDSLNKLNEIEKKTIEKIFNSVNERIGRYIRYFIPDSDAKLEAVDGSPMKGVELHVKIGTWKKGLTELSGGQRSICALSLIFSLLKTKPSPLYILDEIDAALDASHTEAMGRMVSNEFKGSQFIVVSLKDGMYHNANVLFQTYIREGTSGVRRM